MQRVDDLLQVDDAGFGKSHPTLPFEMEGFGHHPDREDAEVARSLGNDRSSTGAGAAAHAGGDEHHMRAVEVIADLIDHFLRRRAPDVGLRAGAQALGHLHAHLNDALGLRHGQGLGIGVGDDEVDALEAGADHVVDGVAAGAADPEHSDPRFQLPYVGDLQVDAHGCLFIARALEAPAGRRSAAGKIVSLSVRVSTPTSGAPSARPAGAHSAGSPLRSFRVAIVRAARHSRRSLS